MCLQKYQVKGRDTRHENLHNLCVLVNLMIKPEFLTVVPGQECGDHGDGDLQVILTFVSTCVYP